MILLAFSTFCRAFRALWGSRGGRGRPQEAPIGAKMPPGGTQRRPQDPQNEPQEASGASKGAPRRSKMSPRRPSEAQNAPQQTQNEPQEAPGGRKRPPDHGKHERFTVGPPDHGKLKRFTRVQRQVPENSFHHRGATRKRSSFGRAPLKQLLFMIPLSVFSLGR